MNLRYLRYPTLLLRTRLVTLLGEAIVPHASQLTTSWFDFTKFISNHMSVSATFVVFTWNCSFKIKKHLIYLIYQFIIIYYWLIVELFATFPQQISTKIIQLTKNELSNFRKNCILKSAVVSLTIRKKSLKVVLNNE